MWLERKMLHNIIEKHVFYHFFSILSENPAISGDKSNEIMKNKKATDYKICSFFYFIFTM